MKIVLKLTEQKEKIDINPLFVFNDNAYCNQTSLKTIVENMENLLSDEQKETISFISVYAGNYEFEDCPETSQKRERKDIHFILRIKDNKPDKILKISSSCYELEDIAELLNKEINDKNIKYLVMRVRGKLI